MSNTLKRAMDRIAEEKLERREILRLMGLTTMATAGLPGILQYARAQDELKAASELIAGKSDLMIVHNDRVGVMETPLELLREHAVTPKDILYLRNNQILEPEGRNLGGVSLDDWTVELSGLVAFPRVVTGAMLAAMPQTEVEMVLQCSGNGRSFYARAVRTRGTQWAHGGMGNVTFGGVMLRDVLASFDPPLNPRPEVAFITAEGADAPPEGASRPDFEHSVPLEDALNRGMLAITMNGEPLPGAHGGPVRLVIPGYYGTMNVKWVSTLRFETEETNNVNQIPRYRVPKDPIEPGTPIDYTFDNSTANWRQRVKSVIFEPLNGAELAAGTVTVRGVAWGGDAPITMVQVSADNGASWQAANLQTPGSTWAWHHFSAELEVASGEQRIWVRAIDELGNSQPLNGTVRWNPSGYEWNGADYVDVVIG
ncbi:MAG: sulfite oxidase [Trueperaceae bacterium]|nr:MAG: sulfite oxidase [Trueperaceae bacterium]